MVNFFLCLLISIVTAYGFSVIFVEKRRDYPVRRYHLIVRHYLTKFSLLHRRLRHMPSMIYCAVCTSFWAALISDFVLFLITHFHYWFWPASGFITAGLTWTIYRVISALEERNEK